jgi:hypothetical protein
MAGVGHPPEKESFCVFFASGYQKFLTASMRAPKNSFQFHSQAADKKLSALNPTKRNPRILSAERRARLKKSLFEYGDLGSIIYNGRTDELVGGNQRVSEFRNDPDAKVTITERLRRPDRCGTVAYGYVLANGTRYSYREVDWDAARATAANLAANKHGGEFDLPVVSELLEELAQEQSTDLDLTGFAPEEIADLVKDIAGDAKDSAQYPITAKLNEDYDYVLIFTDNLTDFIFLQTVCGVKTESSYKKTGIGIGRCVPFARFLTSLHENRNSLNVARGDDDHAPAAKKLPRVRASKPAPPVRRRRSGNPVPS